MKYGKMIVLLLISVYFFIFINKGNAEENLIELNEIAKKGLITFFNRIPEGYKSKYGFEKDDSPNYNIDIGEPFNLYFITPYDLFKFNDGGSLQSILTKSNTFYYPIIVNNEIRSILIIDYINDQWKPVSLGRVNLAQELSKIRTIWSNSNGYNPLLVVNFQAKEYFFSVPEKSVDNLTPINSTYQISRSNKESPHNNKADYLVLDNVSNIVNKLKPIVEKNLNN